MNNRGDTPVWTIIVFGIIAVVVLVLAIIMLSGSATTGGNKITDLFGVISAPGQVQAEQGSSLEGESCIDSGDCSSSNLACANNICTNNVVDFQELIVNGVTNCAKNYETISMPGAAVSKACVSTKEGAKYQIEYNNGAIIYDKKRARATTDKIVMLDVRTKTGYSILTTPALPTTDIDKKENTYQSTWLPPDTMYYFEGEGVAFVCGWYLDKKCSDNDGEVLVRVYQLRETPEADSGETEGTQPGQ